MKKRTPLPSVTSFFLRVLAALLVVNLASAAVLIYIAYTHSRDSLIDQAEESISQQVSVFSDSLANEYINDLFVVQKALEKNSNLNDYLQVSEAERLILARRIEKDFIQVQNDNPNLIGVYYFDENAELKIGVKDGSRMLIEQGQSVMSYDHMLEYASPLIDELQNKDLVLSSGNMEWFIPPREVILRGPFQRKDGGYSLLSGFAKLDLNTGLFAGMLLIHFNLDSWLSSLSGIRIHDQSPVWVISQDGRVMLQPASHNKAENIYDPSALLPEGEFDTAEIIKTSDGMVVFQDVRLGERGDCIRIVCSIPASLLVQGLAPAVDFFSLILLASVISLVVVSFVISRLLVKPFNDLAIARNNLVTAQKIARIGHWNWNMTSQSMLLSDNALSILGLPGEQNSIEFTSVLKMVHEDDREELSDLINNAVRKGESATCEYRLLTPIGEEIVVFQSIDVIEQGGSSVMGTVQDITERRQTEARIRELAYQDSVTGLANRSMLDEVAEHALHTARLHKAKMAVLFLDLDQFKRINDTLGHDAGDELLRQVARRLNECVRPSDTVSAGLSQFESDDMVARLGGDEFIILLSNLAEPADAMQVAERIREALNRPFKIDGKEILSSGSIGISIYPDSAETVGDLLRLADTAMYYAKAQGRNRYVLYSPEIDAKQKSRLSIEAELSNALNRCELELYYQPRYAIDGREIVSFEALLRWNNPVRGLVLPDDFIYIAEENGQIVDIGDWVIATACMQLAKWQQEFSKDLCMSVNLSPIQFMASGLVDRVRYHIQSAGIAATCLELELTEKTLFVDVEAGGTISNQLKDLGVSLSIDDFGTGYSSLQLLSRLPVDTLKIDKSFVQNILRDSDDEMIVQSFISLSKNLELRVVAEGVEEYEQWHMLKAKGCDEMQGFYFSKPCNALDASKLLNEQRQQEVVL